MEFREELISFNDRAPLSRTKQQIAGILTGDRLIWLEKGEERVLPLADVVGASIPDTPKSLQEFSFVVSAYPLERLHPFSRKSRRTLREYKFSCPDLETRSRWVAAINNTLRGFPVDTLVKPRHLQIFINPHSGKQKAEKIWQQVRLLLEKSQISFSVTTTTDKGETQALLRTLSLEKIDGLVAIGGDGTLYETIDGLMQRSDWKTAMAMPIGIIPAGTSNGLSKSLLEIAGEPYDALSAAFAIAKGKTQPLGLMLAKQDKRRYYSLLSLSWGFVSDVDIESDKWRYLGSLKNDLYALARMWHLRTYKGKFSFIPVPDWKTATRGEGIGGDRSASGSSNCQPCEVMVEDEFVLLWAMNVPWAAHNMKATPYARLDDGAIDILVVRKGISRSQLLRAFLMLKKGEHIHLPYVEYYKVRAFRLEPLSDRGTLALDGEPIDYCPIEMEVLPRYLSVFCGDDRA